ncbi:MAG: 2-oxo-4-hydroxy-4-carboxy-5-ureidoimidazoline decarboxylase [Candidatus Planktophila sp.]|nr:2-oxo-4-hydroxy-4-carboxy-5-ureidoimidazoline decarboxylase [Candidatus Planktophila sp.]
MPSLAEINALDSVKAHSLFKRCTIAAAYCDALVNARPYSAVEDLNRASDQATSNLDSASLLIAFSGHPRIGERKGHSTWSSTEQSGLSAADVKTLEELAAANRAYESKFDHVFLICATGKTGAEMLKECNRRSNNSPEVEIQEAREQLRLINRIRIHKLLEEV